MKTNKIVLIVICVFVVLVASWYVYVEREKFTPNFETLYSEPNLNCSLGDSICRLSTGNHGVCDPRSRKCISVPYYFPQNVYKNEHLAPPVGEPNAECQWRGICNRSNNEMGVCMSGLCYPNSHEVV